MKSIPIALMILFSFTQAAFAADCREQFIEKFVPDDASVKSFRSQIISTTNGDHETKANVLSIGKNHILTQPLVPEAPWTLVYNQNIFISNDKGLSWNKVSAMPEIKMDEAALTAKAAAIAKIGNAECGMGTYEGREANTIQAELDTTSQALFKTTVKFWLDKETAETLKMVTDVEMTGSRNITTQLIEAAPDLELPMPE